MTSLLTAKYAKLPAQVLLHAAKRRSQLVIGGKPIIQGAAEGAAKISPVRLFSDVVSPQDEGERKLTIILKERFPSATRIEVTDISGGCGSMYEVHVDSNEFAGMRTVAQHKLVTNALKEEVGQMHGLRVFTTVAE